MVHPIIRAPLSHASLLAVDVESGHEKGGQIGGGLLRIPCRWATDWLAVMGMRVYRNADDARGSALDRRPGHI